MSGRRSGRKGGGVRGARRARYSSAEKQASTMHPHTSCSKRRFTTLHSAGEPLWFGRQEQEVHYPALCWRASLIRASKPKASPHLATV